MNHGSLFRVLYIKEDKRPMLVNFKFQCYKYFQIAGEGRQGKIEYSILLEYDSDTQQDNEKEKGEIIITILIIL